MDERIRKVMAEVLDVTASDITEDSSPHDIASWDSVKHLNLVLALEEEFDIHFDEAEIASLVNYRIIVATIRAYVE